MTMASGAVEKVPEFFFFFLALADVPVGFEDGNRLAGGVCAQSPATGDGDFTAVAPLVDKFALPEAFPEHLILYFRKGPWKGGLEEFVRDPASRFPLGPTVGLLGAAIPIDDSGIETSNEDSIVGEVENFGLFAIVGLADAQIELDLAPLALLPFRERRWP